MKINSHLVALELFRVDVVYSDGLIFTFTYGLFCNFQLLFRIFVCS